LRNLTIAALLEKPYFHLIFLKKTTSVAGASPLKPQPHFPYFLEGRNKVNEVRGFWGADNKFLTAICVKNETC